MRRLLKAAGFAGLVAYSFAVLSAPPRPLWVINGNLPPMEPSLSGDGRWFAVPERRRGPQAARDFAVHIFDARSGNAATVLDDGFSGVGALALSPDGNQVAVCLHPADGPSAVRVYDWRTGKQNWQAEYPMLGRISGGDVKWQGNHLLVHIAGTVSFALLYETSSWEKLEQLRDCAATLTPDGRGLFYCGASGSTSDCRLVALVPGAPEWCRNGLPPGQPFVSPSGTTVGIVSASVCVALAARDGAELARRPSPEFLHVSSADDVVDVTRRVRRGVARSSNQATWSLPNGVDARKLAFLDDGPHGPLLATQEASPILLPDRWAAHLASAGWEAWPYVVRHCWRDAKSGQTEADFSAIVWGDPKRTGIGRWLPHRTPGVRHYFLPGWFGFIAAYEDLPRRDWLVRISLALAPWLALTAWRRWRRRRNVTATFVPGGSGPPNPVDQRG